MPDFFILKWKSLTFLQKVLLIAGLPLVLILWFTSWGIQILSFLEKITRSNVDKKSKDIEQKINEQKIETGIAEEKVKQLEEERHNVANESKEKTIQEAVDFWNSRSGGDDK